MDGWDAYLGAVKEAYTLAKGEEAARLRGRRLRTFDERGIHPFSEAYGKVALLGTHPEVAPYLPETSDHAGGLLEATSLAIRQAARVDALEEFIRDVKEDRFDGTSL